MIYVGDMKPFTLDEIQMAGRTKENDKALDQDENYTVIHAGRINWLFLIAEVPTNLEGSNAGASTENE